MDKKGVNTSSTGPSSFLQTHMDVKPKKGISSRDHLKPSESAAPKPSSLVRGGGVGGNVGGGGAGNFGGGGHNFGF